MDREHKIVEKSMYYSRGSNSQNLDLILPKSKFDTKALDHLRLNMDPRRWSDIGTSYDLLYWCADINWPTARHTHQLFLAHPQNAVAPVRRALQMCENMADGDEDDFVFSFMCYIVQGLPLNYIRELKPDMESFVRMRFDIEEPSDEWDLREVFDDCLGMIESDNEVIAAAANVTADVAVVAVRVDPAVDSAGENASVVNHDQEQQQQQQQQQTTSRSGRLEVNDTRSAGPSSRSVSAGSSSSSGRRRR